MKGNNSMASFDIQISRPAEKDLMDIKNYISKELAQPNTAQKFLAKLSRKINNLEKKDRLKVACPLPSTKNWMKLQSQFLIVSWY